jgi:hypothetical protein
MGVKKEMSKRNIESFATDIFWWAVIMMIAVATILLVQQEARAQDRYFIMRDMSFEGGKYTNDAVRNTYLNTPKDFILSHRTAINWDVDLACYYWNDICLFWNNKVEGLASQAAYKYVSWEFESGLAFRYLDIYFLHKSEHILEEERPQKSFPNSDSIMFRLKFIDNPRTGWRR